MRETLLLLLALNWSIWADPWTLQLTGERADKKFGTNRPRLRRSAPELARQRDRNGALASHLLHSQGLPCLASRQARWLDQGEWVSGSASPWKEDARTLVKFPASKMSNPDEAVALVIWREFLGDGDALTAANPYAGYYSLSPPWFVPLREEIQESPGDSRVVDP